VVGVTDLMSSGEFAARTRLGRKALRLYHEVGLLEPVRVDPRTGYRWYAGGQVRRARLISMLRRLELSLDEIRALLDLPGDAAAKALAGHWSAAEEAHAERRRLVRYINDLLSGREQKTMFDIRTRDIGEQKLVSIQRNVAAPKLAEFIDEAYGMLYSHIGGPDPVAGPAMVIYHGEVGADADGPVEVCLPVTGAVEPAGGIAVRLEPARTEAYTTIAKNQVRYPEILQAYDAVDGWLGEHGHKPALSPREVYFGDMRTAAVDEPVCDVAFPYEVR
jgi:DNA-binding transcriptional MerR regulator